MWYLKHHGRRIIRSFMKPMQPEAAKKWLVRARILYFAMALAAFGYSYRLYSLNKEELDKIRELDPTTIHRNLRLKGEPGKVMIYRIGLGQKPEYYEYENQEYIKNYQEKAEKLEVLSSKISKEDNEQ